tara:strand:- start:41524 stop:42804 length:1281 start_codon:yes stop_codon:yes gene_type:complete
MSELEKQLKSCKQSSRAMLRITLDEKKRALLTWKEILDSNRQSLLNANQKDLNEQKNKISSALYQRLELTESKIDSLVQGIQDLADMPDIVGHVNFTTDLDEKLQLKQVTVPIGVIGVIFESRPDVIPQILSLILKSSNVGILKGGKEAYHSNAAFMKLVDELNSKCPYLPDNWATLVESRDEINSVLKYDQYIDLMIPRGSNELVSHVMNNTKIPVLGHADGICHIYLDSTADIEKSIPVIVDSKIQYPSACNALETLLIHQDLSEKVILRVLHSLIDAGVKIFGCDRTRKIDASFDPVENWSREYGDLQLSVKIVENMGDAVLHINEFGSGHTDVILTESTPLAEEFFQVVDSSSVMQNSSTRFADGFRYGFGAEVGISTAKTHARGPVGIEGLVIYKYQLIGNGQTVKDYTGPEAKPFLHNRH